MAGIVARHQVGLRLLQALGLAGQGRCVQRIVIDCHVHSTVKVYIQDILTEGQVAGVCEALEDARQSDLVEVIPVADVEVDERTGEVRPR